MTSESPQNPAAARSVILAIHRDGRYRELLQLALSGGGYQVVLAPDTEEAIGQLRRHRPDFILLDGALAEECGVNHCHALRSGPYGVQVPLILISDDAPAEACAQAQRLGADDSLSRPFAPAELLLRVRRQLDQAEARRLLTEKSAQLERDLKRAGEELEATRRRNRLQRLGAQALVDFSHRVEERFDAADLQRHALIHLGTLLHVGGLCLFEPPGRDSAWLVPSRWHGLPEERVRGLRLPLSSEFVRILGVEARPLRLAEFERIPGTSWESGLVAAAGFALIAPLVAHRRLIGLIAICERFDGRPYDAADLELMALFTAAMAQMLDAARVRERERQLTRSSLNLVVERLEAVHPWLAGHSSRVSRMACEVGRRVGLNTRDLDDLGIVCVLHDLGRAATDPRLFNREGPLSSEEMELVGRYPLESARLAEMAGWGDAVVLPIRLHKEWWSGQGGRVGLARQAIPIGARILLVADCYDAMMSPRPHRGPLSQDEARRYIAEQSGRQFDPLVADALLDLVMPSGSSRRLAS